MVAPARCVMTESLLPDQLTPVGPTQLYIALRAAWQSVVPGVAASRGGLVLLVAHWALETGFGRGMHRFNVGNKKHVPGDGHDYVQFRCLEYHADGTPFYIDPPAPGCQFVAFPSLEPGAADYLAGLHAHFGAAWLDAVRGNVSQFCVDLRAEHYYTAPEDQYEAGVTRCYHQLDAIIPPDTLRDPSEIARAALEQAENEIDETGHDSEPTPA